VFSLWDEPAVPDPPKRVWRDWVLVGALVLAALLEGTLRPDVTWRPLAVALAIALAVTLLWRRTHPLAVLVIVMSSVTVVDLLAPYAPNNPFGLFSMAYVLLLPYALGRWASGRAIVVGVTFTLATHALRELVHANPGDLLLGIPFLLAPALLGLAVRYAVTSRTRELDQVKMREREQLARDLHDTVAHHVSAIVIQAQAGRVLASANPDAAVEALRVIETEASATLAEMRDMVGTLRDGQAAELVPQHGVADIEQLAEITGGAPQVDVQLTGELDTLRPAVGAAIYRMAQESITKAARHARRASRIDVRVIGDEDTVRLTVVDDGEAIPPSRAAWGYGLVGMTERAALLGGTLEAGPGPDRGWAVTAVLPRTAGRR
jgi:signal transduction histidine kinase